MPAVHKLDVRLDRSAIVAAEDPCAPPPVRFATRARVIATVTFKDEATGKETSKSFSADERAATKLQNIFRATRVRRTGKRYRIMVLKALVRIQAAGRGFPRAARVSAAGSPAAKWASPSRRSARRLSG